MLTVRVADASSTTSTMDPPNNNESGWRTNMTGPNRYTLNWDKAFHFSDIHFSHFFKIYTTLTKQIDRAFRVWSLDLFGYVSRLNEIRNNALNNNTALFRINILKSQISRDDFVLKYWLLLEIVFRMQRTTYLWLLALSLSNTTLFFVGCSLQLCFRRIVKCEVWCCERYLQDFCQ